MWPIVKNVLAVTLELSIADLTFEIVTVLKDDSNIALIVLWKTFD